MSRLREIQGHIASMSELLDVVGAMRSLASMRVQEAQRALPGISRYADTVAAGIAAALPLLPDSDSAAPQRDGRALVLFAGEHGFVGGFNERLLDVARTCLGPDDALLVLGSRGAALAEQHGLRLLWQGPMATRLASISTTIGPLQAQLYRGIAAGSLSRIEVLFARYRQAGPPELHRETLLPLALPPLPGRAPAQPPLHNLPPPELLQRLTAEYVFALLTAAAVESMASENAARFAAMEAAHGNVETRLLRLRQEGNQARQAEITEELLDLITGTRTQTGG